MVIKKKWFKILISVIAAILGLIIITLSVFAIVFRKELKNIRYVEKVDDYRFYTMEYELDYDIDELMQTGVSNDQEYLDYIISKVFKGLPIHIDISKYACSTFSAKTPEGDYLFGRNFDWGYSPSMLLKTTPKNGYASLSMVNLGFVGYDDTFLPDGYLNRILTLAAPYVPMDGINEKGLAIGVLYLETEPTAQNTEKVDIVTTAMIRIVLDKAANVEEAIELFSKFDMHDSVGACYHYQICDASGASVVIEYVNNEMRIITPEERLEGHSYQMLTNYFLSEDGDNSKPFGEDRYAIMEDRLSTSSGILTKEQSMELLKDARIVSYVWPDGWEDKTQWSAVCDLTNRSVDICIGMNYGTVFSYAL
jgi:hypothetical protein